MVVGGWSLFVVRLLLRWRSCFAGKWNGKKGLFGVDTSLVSENETKIIGVLVTKKIKMGMEMACFGVFRWWRNFQKGKP